MTRSLKTIITIILTSILLWSMQLAFATSYSISPIKLVAQSSDKILEFRLTNVSDKEVPVQIQIKRWEQADNQNKYLKTFDLLPTPVTATLEPRQTQFFRIGVMIPNDSDITKSYRLFVRELPSVTKKVANAKTDKINFKVDVLLNISIPVLLLPKQKLIENYDWSYKKLDNNIYQLTIENTGNSVIKTTELSLTNKDNQLIKIKNAVQYILPQQQYNWKVQSETPLKDITAVVNAKNTTTALDS